MRELSLDWNQETWLPQVVGVQLGSDTNLETARSTWDLLHSSSDENTRVDDEVTQDVRTFKHAPARMPVADQGGAAHDGFSPC